MSNGIRCSAFLALAMGLALSLLPCNAFGAVAALDASASATETSGSQTSLTLSYTVSAGSNRLLVVTSGGGGNTGMSVSSVKYNGVNMSSGSTSGSGPNSGIWYLTLGTSASPTTANVVITYNKTYLFNLTASSFQGVDQTTPVSGATSNAAASLVVASSTGDLVIDAINGSGSGQAVGASQTLVALNSDIVFGGDPDCAASTEAGAASVTMDWTGFSGVNAHVGLNIKQAPAPAAPTVTTNAATGVSASGATFNGTVNANNASTTVTFQYGLSTSYGSSIAATPSPVTGASATAVSTAMTGLIPGATYHYRAVGVNSQGTTNGADQTFTTTVSSGVSVLGTPASIQDNATLSFTVPAGNNRLLVVTASDDDTNSITGVTYNGTAMVLGKLQSQATNAVDSIWYLVQNSSASPTTANVIVTSASAPPSFVSAQAFQNVNQTTPVSSPQSDLHATVTNATSTLTVASAAGDLVFDVCDIYDQLNGGTLTPAAGQTVFQTLAIGSPRFAFYKTSALPGAASVNISFSSQASDMIHVALNIKQSVPLTIAPAALVDWTVNKSGYSQIISASGGSTPYSFSVTAGALPGGLTLTSGGVLSGTPTATGTFNFTVSATDSGSGSGSQAYTVVINPAVTVSPATLPDWTINRAGYSQTVTSANGTGAKTLSVSAGAIPPGMTFTAGTGVLNGTPTATGTFNFTITATDTVGATGSQAYTIIINPAVTVSPATLPDWTINRAGYSQTVTGANGTGAKTLSVSAGAIPTGMTFTAGTGVLNGTPTAAGTFNFTITATDTVGATGSQAYTIIINPAVTVSPASLPDWTINRAGYSQAVTSANGTGAKTLSVSAGAIPTGMTFTAGSGVLNGTPTATGTFNFTITATDIVGATGSQAYTIIINPAVTVSPATLPDWTINRAGYSQTVTSANGTGAKTLSVSAGAIPTGMTFTAGTGVLNGTPTAAGTFNFTITATDTVGATGAQAYTIVINAAVTVSPATLPNWTINRPGYSQTVTSANGTGAKTLSLTAGSVPTGMTFTAGTGVLNGTPTTSGTFNFTITATDTVGATGSQAYTVVINPAVTVSPATLPDWTINKTGYSQTISGANGTGAKTLSLSAGAIPTGMTFTAGSGVLNGTPTATGTFNFTITATDTVGATGAQAYTIVINPAVTITTASLPGWTLNTPGYSQTISATGGTGAITFAVTAGAIPTGMSLSTGGLLNGTPTATGTFNFTVTATDSVGATGSQAYSITIVDITITPSTLPNWTVNQAGYSQSLSGNNGTAPYTFAVTAGALPGGLTLTPAGVLSGTPTAAGTFNFTITATDSVPASGSQAYTVVINSAVSITTLTLADWTVNRAGYNQTIAASNGTGAKTFAVTAGILPTGLTLSGAGALTGTPTATGTFNFTVTATDTVGATGTQAYAVVINPAVNITTATLVDWTVNRAGYSQTIAATNGTGAKTFAVSAGALPTGLTLSGAGALSGTPTVANTFNFTVTATDTVGATGSQAYTVVINPAVTITTATLVDWTINQAGYSQTISASNGTGAKTFTVSAGLLPTGLTLSSAGALTGTPTAAGTFNFTITATDTVGATGSRAYTIVINPVVTVTPATLPDWTINHAGYSQTVTSSNGTGAKTLAVSAGSIPTGMTFTAGTGVLDGTPTATGTFNFTITATDTVGATGSQAYTIVINPAVSITTATLSDWTINLAGYGQTVAATGGTGALTFAVSAGAVPTGLSLSAGGVLSGTPTVANTFNFTVTGTDTVGATGSQAYTVVINPAIVISPLTLPDGTVYTAYSQNVSNTGGTGTSTFAVTAGSLPTGLSLSSAGAVTGNPTATGAFTFTITATDTVGATGTQAYTVNMAAPTIVISPATLTAAKIGNVYNQTLSGSGGIASYTFAISGGALPAGITLSNSGVLSGTPTAGGNFIFDVTATDASTGTGPYASTQSYALVVSTPTIVLAPTTLPPTNIGTTYSQTVTASGGTAPYTFAVTTGALPTGISLSAAGVISGSSSASGTATFTITATDSSTGTGPFTGNVALSVLVNHAPALGSGPTATPNPAIANQPVQFNVTATDADSDSLAYLWDFNDGTSSTQQNPIHPFLVPGIYVVSVTVDDGHGATTVATVSVEIRVGFLGEGDADKDGFADEIEAALGSDPFSATSTPAGVSAPLQSVPMTNCRLNIHLHFGEADKDFILLTGRLPLSTAVVAGSKFIVDVGGVVKFVTMSSTGRAEDDLKRVALQVRRTGAKRNFRLQLSKESFAKALADEQLTAAAAKNAPRNVNVMIILQGVAYTASIKQSYTSQNNVGRTSTPR